MPNVKIELKGNETPEEAEDLLFKAFSAQRDGSIHREEFHDPAMRDFVQRLVRLHEVEYQEMLREISDALEAEYSPNGD